MSLLKCPRCGNPEAETISINQENIFEYKDRTCIQCRFCKFEMEGGQLGDKLCVP